MLKVAIYLGFIILFTSFNIMRKIIYFLVLVLPIVFIRCDLDDEEQNCELITQGVIKDYTGFDGCGFLIVSDSSTFEVLNWDEINFIPKDGMEVCFDYDIELEAVSICMMGQIVWLTDCQVLED